MRKNNWRTIKLWHFFNHVPDAEFDIVIDNLASGEHRLITSNISIQENQMQCKGFKSLSDEDDIDDDKHWEKKLPDNYQRYIEMFSWQTRLGRGNDYLFETTLQSVMLSPQYTYACYLKFKDNYYNVRDSITVLFKTECKLDRIFMGEMISYWSKYPMNIPTIKPNNDSGLHESSNILKAEGLAIKNDATEHLGYTRIEERMDGWMEWRPCFMDPSHSSALSSVSQNSHVVSLNALTEEIVAYEKESDDTHAVKSGTVYYIPKVSAAVLLVKGNVYDSVDDCVVAYMKYAAEAGFVVRRSCQKRMLNGDVRQKYLVCNRMGCPKGIHVDTLDLGNSDKQKRNSNLHITGCKARAVFNLDTCTRKFVLKVFDTIHNHELERATRAHHLLTGIKGSYLLVHGTTVDFKNFFRSVNCYIGDSDAQMLIHKMENRKKHVSDFSFDYLVDNAELTTIFWADESKAPSIVVTDQDGAMRNAIEAEFGGSKHRLCMWHITQKLPAKGKLMEEFKLENHKWLTKMFNIRTTWILAYFIDSPLCGLMRTTS
ncbi:protein FAR1-related sequence 5, partial [Tanacetum coccineum]